MATPSKVHLTTEERPAYFVPRLRKDTAEKSSLLLQENHDKHHIFFNQDGFHNHIVHHLLTLYALGVVPDVIQTQYDNNKTYQRPPVQSEQSVVKDMHDPAHFKKYLGDEKYYHDYLIFFREEMESKGWEAVVNEYLFKGDERADDMLVRLFGGFLHPLIHLGFGIEFQQPAIVAEALALTCAHSNWMGAFLLGAEKSSAQKKSSELKNNTLVQLLDAIHANEKVAKAAHWDDPNKLRDGSIARAGDELCEIAGRYTVGEGEEELERKTAEMINAAVYFTAAAAHHPPHAIKFDFFYMHSVTSSILLPPILAQPWLTRANAARLLAWKARADLAMYASRAAPPLLLPYRQVIDAYVPKRPADDWAAIFERVAAYPEAGHAAKLVRAIAHGEDVCRKWDGRDGFPVKGAEWRLLGHMAIDSVEAGNPTWVRGAGFEQAWEQVPLRKGQPEPHAEL